MQFIMSVHIGCCNIMLRADKLLYGDSYVTSKVHPPVYVAADTKLFGSLDACSAWMLENYLFYVKRMIKSGFRPLEQVTFRLAG